MKKAFVLLGIPGVLALSLFAQDYQYKNLGSLGKGSTQATALNSSGQVVGSSKNLNRVIHAFLWSLQDGIQDLGTLPGMRTSIASGINDGGQVVGCSETADGSSRRVFSWTVADGMEDVGPIDGGPCDASVNNLGQVVWSPHLQNMGHVFRWTHSGGAQDLGFSAYAVATNSSGQISGTAPFQNQDHAFLWSQAGGLQDLGTINGWEHSDAFGMNETGDVVGSTSPNVIPPQDAFIWTQNGGMQGLGVSFGT